MNTFDVRMPDGTLLQGIPEGTSKDEIAAKYQAMSGAPAQQLQAPQQPQAPTQDDRGFIERSYDTLRQGASDAYSTIAGDTYGAGGDPTARRKETLMGKSTSVAGSDILPAVGEVGADALISAGKAVLPQEAEDAIAKGAKTIGQSGIVQKGMQAWDKFEDSNPDLARQVGQLGTVATTLTPGPKLKTPKTKLAPQYGRVRARQNKATRQSEVERMLTPDMDEKTTQKVLEKGPLGQREYQFTPETFEADVVKEVRNLRTINPKKSYQHNVNAVNAEVKALANKLDNDLADVEIDTADAYNKMLRATQEAAEHPAFVGNSKESAVRMFSIFDDMMKKALKGRDTISASELLAIRRQFDEELLKFDAPSHEYLNAKRLAGDALRKKMNDIIIKASPDVKVQKSLDAQHRLLSARSVMAPRAAKEAGTAVGRLLDNFARHTGVHMPTTPLAAGATATHLPTAAAMTALMAGYGLTRPLTKAAKASYHQLLKAVDEVVAKGGKTAEVLAADRQALLELTQQTLSEEEE